MLKKKKPQILRTMGYSSFLGEKIRDGRIEFKKTINNFSSITIQSKALE